MATVPTYNGPQVRSTALQPVFQREIDVSSGLKAASTALGQVADVADKAVRRDAETEANRVDTEITAGWLQWDAENRRRYQGQNIDQYKVEADKWWEKARETYGKDLSPLAQSAVGPTLGRKRMQAMSSVANHVNAEKDRFADQQSEAAAQTSIEFGIDTGDTAGAGAQVRKINAEKAARKGWTPEMLEAENQRHLGTMHLAYITRRAETDAAGAQAYFEANKGEIPAGAQVKVEQVLKGEGDNQFATQFAAQQATKPLGDQLAAAAEIKDPQRREKTLQQIRNNHAMVEAAKRQNEAQASDDAWQLVGKGQRVPERILMQMNGKERVQLQEHLVDRSKVVAAGTPVKTDWAVYEDLRVRLSAGEKVQLAAYSTKLAPGEMEKLIDYKTKKEDPKKAPEVATTEQQLNAVMADMDLKGENKGKFQAAAYDRYNDHLKRTGKEPNYDERQAINDALARDVVTHKGILWDTTVPAYKAPKDVRDAALTADKFTAGQVYTDKNGARAKYLGGGKWEPIK